MPLSNRLTWIATPEDHSPGLSTPGAGQSEHAGIYSGSGFDILGVLVSYSMTPFKTDLTTQ